MPARTPQAAFDIRALMLDPGRLTEKHPFYFDLLPQLAKWGYNSLWWHFSDDEGFALKLKSHPELASPFAFTRAGTRRLVREAARLGIDVVPEVESLGHSLAITGLPRYAHLFNGKPQGHNAICPSHPETLPLLGELIAEVAELFDSPYLHAGLDEAVMADCPRCARRGRGRPPWWVFARHVLAVHRLVRAAGKEMIMWADSVEKHPELLDVLPRDIILAHWHYGAVPAAKIEPSVKAGFRIVCVPAISGQLLQPDAAALRNVDDMVALAARLPRRSCRGVAVCWWEPFRNVRDAYPLAAAYAGQAMRTGRPAERPAFARRFAADYFGLRDAGAAGALWRLHELTHGRSGMHALYPDSPADIVEALKLAAAPGFAARAAEAESCVQALEAAAGRVISHRAEYNAALLAGRVTATAWRNGCRLADAYAAYLKANAWLDGKAPRAEILELLDAALLPLEAIGSALAPLARDMSREWDRTRHRGDDKKDNSSPRIRQRAARAILPIVAQSDRYLRQLVPRVRRAIAAYGRGGPFPAGL